MNRTVFIISVCLLLTACSVHKKRTKKPSPKRVVVVHEEKKKQTATINRPITHLTKADHIVETALQYTGVRYKYGGTTKRGMDCSGLIYVAFQEHEVPLERVSYRMAQQGKAIGLRQIRVGDLLFFKTSRKNRINHVGLVVAVGGDGIRFVHATSSRGVIVSSLKEGYWNHAFVKARRVL